MLGHLFPVTWRMCGRIGNGVQISDRTAAVKWSEPFDQAIGLKAMTEKH